MNGQADDLDLVTSEIKRHLTRAQSELLEIAKCTEDHRIQASALSAYKSFETAVKLI